MTNKCENIKLQIYNNNKLLQMANALGFLMFKIQLYCTTLFR